MSLRLHCLLIFLWKSSPIGEVFGYNAPQKRLQRNKKRQEINHIQTIYVR